MMHKAHVLHAAQWKLEQSPALSAHVDQLHQSHQSFSRFLLVMWEHWTLLFMIRCKQGLLMTATTFSLAFSQAVFWKIACNLSPCFYFYIVIVSPISTFNIWRDSLTPDLFCFVSFSTMILSLISVLLLNYLPLDLILHPRVKCPKLNVSYL